MTQNHRPSHRQPRKLSGKKCKYAVLWLVGTASAVLVCYAGMQGIYASDAGNRQDDPIVISPSPDLSPELTPTPSGTTSPKPDPAVKGPHNVLPRVAAEAPRVTAASGSNPVASASVLIKNIVTRLCVDISGSGKGSQGGQVQQDTCAVSNHDNQRWDLVVGQKGAGPRGADLFTIHNTKAGYCLDLPGTGVVSFTTGVTEGRCIPGSGDNQMWYLDQKGTGSYWIRNAYSKGLCLDVDSPDDVRPAGAKLTVFPCTLKDDHLWSFA